MKKKFLGNFLGSIFRKRKCVGLRLETGLVSEVTALVSMHTNLISSLPFYDFLTYYVNGVDFFVKFFCF